MDIYLHPFPNDRNKAIERAKEFLAGNPLFLDTETTGLDNDSEICEIAIIEADGNVLLNTLVKPMQMIPAAATEIHHITNAMVASYPTLAELMPKLEQILRGREVLVYNSEFDEGMLGQSARLGHCEFSEANPGWWYSFRDGNFPGTETPWYRSYWHCVMKLYAKFYGDWNDFHGNYRWIPLSRATMQCGLQLPKDIHRAYADAELTRRIVLFMAEQKVEPIQEQDGG